MSNLKALTYPCLSLDQGKYKLYCFTASAKKMWQVLDINERDPDKDKGYQRALSGSRVKAIANYISGGNSIPNSILVSLVKGTSVAGGKITIPNTANAGWVIDGQHRLAGANESDTDIDLVFIAFIGLDKKEQIKQFVTINREAKGVPTSLYYDLIKQLPLEKPDDIAKARASDIAKTLRADEQSPFFNKVVITPPKKGQLSLTNFVRKISPVVLDNKGKFYTYTFQEQTSILDNYFRALKHTFPEQFKDEKQTFFKTLGFGAMVNALPTVFDLTLKEKHSFTIKDIIEILKTVDYFPFDSWDQLGTGSAAEIQAGEDFRTELLKMFNESTGSTGSLRL